jgi:hypothetical protein
MNETTFKKVVVPLMVGMAVVSWTTWIVLIYRHWEALQDGSHLSAIAFLVLFPIPLIQWLRGSTARQWLKGNTVQQQMDGCLAAFFTYLLLLFATLVRFH